MSRKDVFADIAAKRVQYRNSVLFEPQPRPVPDTLLPIANNDTHGFTPLPKINTADGLAAELAARRAKVAPFLLDLAPKPTDFRTRIPLPECDWRCETAADRLNFPATLAGDGEWERVQIPHFGGPLGRGVTYYRTTFMLPKKLTGKAIFVHFNGVDYKAHVFVNGALAGSHEGFFAPFEFDITTKMQPGENTLLVKVENDFICMGSRTDDSDTRFEGDKIYAATGVGYDDPEVGWHHCPPGMGIYQDMFVEIREPLFIHDVFVRPNLAEKRAEAWVEIWNCDFHPQELALRFSLYGQNFEQTVFENLRLEPSFTAQDGDTPTQLKAEAGQNYFKLEFDLPDPHIWSPETPWLYQLQLTLETKGQDLDIATQQFGMRDFIQDKHSEPKGRFYLNGAEIRLRGANTMGHLQQCVFKKDWDQLIDDILLAKICNMNFLRLTQRPVQPEIYDYCDRLGLMTQTDMPLFAVLKRNQFCEAVRQAEEMERLVRPHACNIMVSYINEPFPHGWNKPHRHLIRDELENFFTAASLVIRQANPDRVIKTVDGDYDPPAPGMPDNHCYCGWYNGHGLDIGKLNKGFWQNVKPGWMYGCGEFGSEGLERESVMRRYYPKHWLPQDEAAEKGWNPNQIVNAQSGRFHYMWFDTQDTLADWITVSQAHQEWTDRLMTEAFRRDDRMNTFAIHLFIDAFPAGWMKTIMDVERQPKPAYFAYRKALEPLMVSVRSDRWAYESGESITADVWICNDTHQIHKNASLNYFLEIDGKIGQSGQAATKISACTSVCQGQLRFQAPVIENRTQAMLHLGLVAESGDILADTEYEITLFPTLEKKELPQTFCLGKTAEKLAAELELPRSCTPGQASVIIISDRTEFTLMEKEVKQAVSRGAKAILLEIPMGTHTINGNTIEVKACGMNPRHFVSRKTGHALVRDLAPNDFRLWYDAAENCITPILHTTFSAEGWTPILTSGNGGWAEEWYPALAAAEKTEGRGLWRICQLKLAGRISGNPVAALFAQRLISE